jgi:hypothetical protein
VNCQPDVPKSGFFPAGVMPSESEYFEKQPTPLFYGTISVRIPWFARNLGRASLSSEEHNDQI